MNKPEIIGSTRSTYTRVVRMVCEEKAIDYTMTDVLLGAPELSTIHPFGRMQSTTGANLRPPQGRLLGCYFRMLASNAGTLVGEQGEPAGRLPSLRNGSGAGCKLRRRCHRSM